MLNNNQTCENFYISVLSFDSQAAGYLCGANSVFNWSFNPTNYMGYFQTAVYLVSTYLYPSENFMLGQPNSKAGINPFVWFMDDSGFSYE